MVVIFGVQVVMALNRGLDWQVPIYVAVYIGFVIVAFASKISYRLQTIVLLAMLYGLGLIRSIDMGVLGGIAALWFAAVVLAGLFLGWSAGAITLGVCLVSALLLGWQFSAGSLTVMESGFLTSNTDLRTWVSVAVGLFILGGGIVLAQQNLLSGVVQALSRSRASAQALSEAQRMLESRVAERTADLEKRTRYLQATATVARDTASILDVSELLTRVVRLISEQFEFYHAGLFLIDESGDWAEMKAASSEGGQRMLARNHRLQVGVQGTVGYVAARGVPRIALDVGEDAVYFSNPDLPETRSVMTLPLRARGEIIGVLDVQSREPEAFTEEDVSVLSSLADQVAVAISNARLFERVQQSVDAERRAMGELTREAWMGLLRSNPDLGFVSDHRGTYQIGRQGWRPEEAQVIQAGTSMIPDEDPSVLAVPVKVRDQVIGVIHARLPEQEAAWNRDRRSLMEALAQQLGTALESARLYRQTQQRAAREQLTIEISDRIRSSLNIDTILQTAVREIGEAMDVHDLSIEFQQEPTYEEM
jgi:GAF domain-containing protein